MKKIICKDVFGNQYTVSVDELNIRIGVYAVIIENGKILLTRQWDGYSLIGGGVEKGETIEEAVIREVKEETGLAMMPDKIIHQATTFFKRNAEAKANQSIQLYFTHSQLRGEISNDEITASEKTYTHDTPEWVDLNEIDKINFRHSVSYYIIILMNDAKEEIRDRLNIEDVIGEYVELKRAGRNFKALSPFSNEKTPSFIVSPDKRIWHDFSSGKGGDVFSFVMEMEGVDFKEALKILARKAGVELQLFNSANSQKLAKRKAREQEMYTLVTKYYQAILAKNPHALDYAKIKRHLTDETLKDFAIGYAPNHKRALLDFLLKRGYQLPEITQAGLLNQYKTDLFRARLMIPLSDAMGQTIGFTGRGLEADAIPKYLNTPATLLYDKSRHVFGLFQAKEAIRKLDQAVIVEGNMDVISSHQAGVKQVVATAGTAMTEQHLKILARYTSDIRLAFDADNAGINATERAITLAQTVNVDIKIISLIGDAKDPDELIQQDVVLWQQSIDRAEPAVDWLMRVYQAKFDLSQSPAKRDYSRKILATIAQLSDPVEKESYLQKLADIVEISLEAIKSQLEELNKPQPKKALKPKKASPDSVTDEFKYQDELLAMCLISKEARQALATLDMRAMVDFKDKPRQQLAELLIQAGDDFTKDQLGGLQDLTIYGKVLTLKTEERYLLWSKTEVEREARRLVNQSKADFQKNLTEQLTDQLRQAEYDGDENRATAIRAELNQLIKGDKK